MNVILTKVTSTHNNLRTDQIVGKTLKLPTIGQSFQMTSEPLTPGTDIRVITTSLVEEFKDEDGVIEFKTRNSTYLLQVLDN